MWILARRSTCRSAHGGLPVRGRSSSVSGSVSKQTMVMSSDCDRPDGVLADGRQDGLAGGGGPVRGRGQDFFQAFDAERLAVLVHRLGDAVGIEDDQVARLEGNGDGPVDGRADDTQRRARPPSGRRPRSRPTPGAPGGPCARR